MRVSNWKPQAFDGEIMTAAMDRLEAAAEVIAADARRRVPVGTGALKKSIRVVRLRDSKARNVRVYAGNRVKGGSMQKGEDRGAFYAQWVEYGHGPKKKAHPFLRPALNASKAKIQGILRNGD